MIVLKGKSVCGGVAIGEIRIIDKITQTVKRVHIKNSTVEVERYMSAKKQAIEQIGQLYEKALKEMGNDHAMIFEVHQLMLEDEDYNQSIISMIHEQSVNSEYAIAITCERFSQLFEAMDDSYMQDRRSDVKDISERLISILSNTQVTFLDFDESFIIFAKDLTPSETVQLDKEHILAFVTQQGSSNSHTAILARTMDIPAIVQANIDLDDENNGKLAIVDGMTGTIYIEPDDVTLKEMQQKKIQLSHKKELLQKLKGQENRTLDGYLVNVYANIGSLKDISSVLENDADGIGLFRSEFLYLGRDNAPSEEEQFYAYKMVAENMYNKKVIIRTLDLGADKQVEYFNLEKEENPAMGYRAIRICLIEHEIFKTQLRAIYRASVYGQISIMFPMIISIQEVIKIKEIIQTVQEELSAQGLPYRDIELGIMIETPAAVMISYELAKEVDFFSIGTNDLTQYTLAIDRQNTRLDEFYDSHHPAILRMIDFVVKSAHEVGIWVGICGELAADVSLTEAFLKMGIDELSVAPNQVLNLRERIREIDLSKDS